MISLLAIVAFSLGSIFPMNCGSGVLGVKNFTAADGNKTDWTSWTTCSLSCGNGTQHRYRYCVNPTPPGVIWDCKRPYTETRNCNNESCPGFTNWTNWTTCTLSCGNGTQIRTRSCTNPPPAQGRKNCTGHYTETMNCNNQPCLDQPANWTSPHFENILQQIASGNYNATGLLKELENATKKGKISGGDLGITMKVLSFLTDRTNVGVISDQEQKEFLRICDNILQPINVDSWGQFDKQKENVEKEKSLSIRLTKVLDKYGLILAKQIPSNSSKVIETSSIAMRLDKISPGKQEKKTDLTFKYDKFDSSLNLPPELFSGDVESSSVTIVYKTLNEVMGLRGINKLVNQDGIKVLKPTSTMFSSVVEPSMSGRLNKKVKLTMKNTKEVQRPTCVFWKEGLPETWMTDGCTLVPSESNSHVTTCECDHLTVFASLMDPYGGLIPENDRKALELISTIGCAISLFAILLTIAVTLFFWRALKSPRTIVLMNICVAIGIVCILIIAEGTARATKVGCTVMAVLLHYFLLAVFCWFLCEGLLLYFLIVKVIGGNVEGKVKYFVMFGWGFPLLVVAISLAVTQTEGYGYHGLQTACWLSVDNGLIWAFVGPVIVIMMINIVVFILVIRQMMGTRHAQRKSRDEKLRMGVKATAVILPLLGITWVFGLLSFNTATLAFKYIFAILNSLQGLMIFIFHFVLNQQIKDAIQRKLQVTPTDKQRHALSDRVRTIRVAATGDANPLSIEKIKKSPQNGGIGNMP